jgi:uncharacterized protein YehS (DUF1456 family)
MRNDDIIQSIRYMLDVSDATIAEIIKLGGYSPSREEVASIFHDHFEDEEKEDVSHILTAHFLDGLIYYKRGKSDKHPPRPISIPVSNNTVLKKLRVAFKLREEDILDILESAGFTMTSSELGALFRDKNHRNYKPCGDQILRYFLKGLTDRVRQE